MTEEEKNKQNTEEYKRYILQAVRETNNARLIELVYYRVKTLQDLLK